MSQTLRVHVGICEPCGREHTGIYYVIENGQPTWVCGACEKAHANRALTAEAQRRKDRRAGAIRT